MKKSLKALCLLAIAIGAVNFLSFFVSSLRLGGDAANGYQEDGRYYVANHGRVLEVSEQDWRLNRLQWMSLSVTHPLDVSGNALLGGERCMAEKDFSRSVRR